MNTFIKIAVLVVGIFAGMGGFAHAADQTAAPAAAQSTVSVPYDSTVTVKCNRTGTDVPIKWVKEGSGRCPITVQLQGLAIAANTLGQGQMCFVMGDKRGKLIAVPVKKVGKTVHVFPWRKVEGKAAELKLAAKMC